MFILAIRFDRSDVIQRYGRIPGSDVVRAVAGLVLEPVGVSLGNSVMVARLTLDQLVGVRIPVPQFFQIIC